MGHARHGIRRPGPAARGYRPVSAGDVEAHHVVDGGELVPTCSSWRAGLDRASRARGRARARRPSGPTRPAPPPRPGRAGPGPSRRAPARPRTRSTSAVSPGSSHTLANAASSRGGRVSRARRRGDVDLDDLGPPPVAGVRHRHGRPSPRSPAVDRGGGHGRRPEREASCTSRRGRTGTARAAAAPCTSGSRRAPPRRSGPRPFSPGKLPYDGLCSSRSGRVVGSRPAGLGVAEQHVGQPGRHLLAAEPDLQHGRASVGPVHRDRRARR